MYEIYSELIIKTPERHQWRRSGAFMIDFVRILYIALVFPLMSLINQMPARAHFRKID